MPAMNDRTITKSPDGLHVLELHDRLLAAEESVITARKEADRLRIDYARALLEIAFPEHSSAVIYFSAVIGIESTDDVPAIDLLADPEALTPEQKALVDVVQRQIDSVDRSLINGQTDHGSWNRTHLRFGDGLWKRAEDAPIESPGEQRLRWLATLEAGWDPDDPTSQPIDSQAIRAARELLAECARVGRDLPGVFPMVDGGVQLEWASRHFVNSVEISPGKPSFALFDLFGTGQTTYHEDSASLAEAKKFVADFSR